MNEYIGIALVPCLALSMGAEGQCSAEVESRGEAETWEFGELPAEQPAEPLTCEYLDGGTCWTDMVGQIESCLPPDELGKFSADRSRCTFSDGTVIEWDGTVERPEPAETSLPIIQHRILRPSGSPCFTTRWLGIANVAFDVDGEVGILRADSLTTFTMVCPDGSTYASDVEGTCADTGSRWLAGGLPGYDVVCYGARDSCDLVVKGGPTGAQRVVGTCAF